MSLSIDDLAIKHGQIAPVVVDGGRYQWQHRVADLLHGWSVHNYHHQADAITLSDEDYLAAIRAAEMGLEAHEPAKAKAPDYKARAKALADAQARAAANPMPSAPAREPALLEAPTELDIHEDNEALGASPGESAKNESEKV